MGSDLFQTLAPLILASASPRRQDFLHGQGLDFQVQVADIDEVVAPGESPCEFVKRMAKEKAAVVSQTAPDAWVLAADTVLDVDDEILGKPADAQGAEEMLARLSGRWHEVWTGFALIHERQGVAFCRAVRTEVCFVDLTPELIQAYVLTGEPLDKAGAYGIQGRGGAFVAEIKGSYSNVVGLPLAEVMAALLKHGVVAPVLAP